MNLEIDYIIENDSWYNYIQEEKINDFIKNIFTKTVEELKYNLNKKHIIEISITFSDDEKIKKINHEYRNINSATNVLSFPLFEHEFLKEYNTNPYIGLGDIILSIETLEREAVEQNKTFNNHLIHLIVHSFLHLFGFDHIKENEAELMENLEINILKQLNVENPYY